MSPSDKPGSIEHIFTSIYRNGVWTTHDNIESLSGRGSTLWRTEALRRELPALLDRLGVSSLLDAGCGDFNWLSTVELPGLRYHGIDVVREVVEHNQRRYTDALHTFSAGNLLSDPLPACDAVLCRDCLNHLSLAEARSCLANFRRTRARYLLLTTHPAVGENADCEAGDWRMLNLCLPDFELGEPVELVLENEDLGKYLGVWRL